MHTHEVCSWADSSAHPAAKGQASLPVTFDDFWWLLMTFGLFLSFRAVQNISGSVVLPTAIRFSYNGDCNKELIYTERFKLRRSWVIVPHSDPSHPMIAHSRNSKRANCLPRSNVFICDAADSVKSGVEGGCSNTEHHRLRSPPPNQSVAQIPQPNRYTKLLVAS